MNAGDRGRAARSGHGRKLPVWTRVRFWGRDHPLATIGIVLFVAYALLGAVGPGLVVDPLKTRPMMALQAPSWVHPFGTDEFGRDVFARAVSATRLDLWIGIVISLVSMIVGTIVGVVAGYWGGTFD